MDVAFDNGLGLRYQLALGHEVEFDVWFSRQSAGQVYNPTARVKVHPSASERELWFKMFNGVRREPGNFHDGVDSRIPKSL